MDTTLYSLPLVFIRRHIQAVHVIVELVPTGKVLLPRLHLTNMVLPVPVFIKLMPPQAVDFFPVSLINCPDMLLSFLLFLCRLCHLS